MNTSYTSSSATGSLTDAVVETMVRWPMRMTGATVDAMIRGVQNVTGRMTNGGSTSGSSTTWESSSSAAASSAPAKANSGWTSLFSSQTSGTFDQDLSGDDLKYIIWSIVFTKPGHECILQKQQEELVNYAADSSTFAAVKIAKFLDSARHGHTERPESWEEKSKAAESSGRNTGENEKGWRIAPEDQKYICFLYRVDRRLPKQQEDVTRVERVTVERGTRVA